MKMTNWMLIPAMVAGAMVAPAQTTHTTTHTTTLTRVSQGSGEEPQVKDDLFAGTEGFEKNATDATEINMGPDGLGMAGSRHGEARGMVLNVVRSYSYDKPGMYDMAAVDTIRKRLSSGDWSCSMHERNLKTGESTDVCQRHRTDGMREEAIITVEAKELTFIHKIYKVSADGGHSEVFGDPSVMSHLHGTAAMAYMSPDALVSMEMARHGLLTAQMRGLADLQLDLNKVMRESQLASVQALNSEELRNLADQLKTFTVHVNPDVHVHVHQDFDSDGPTVPSAPEAPAVPPAPSGPQPE